MIFSFAGHSFIPFADRVKEAVKGEMRKHIVEAEPIVCYLGGYGSFDEACARACRELKEEYDRVLLVYVTPYREDAKIKEMKRCGLCDEAVYPPIEKTPLKFAIAKRNEWMMKQADIVIAYVRYSRGGAFQSLLTAKRRKKKIINLCDFL